MGEKGDSWESCCVMVILRHADRTCKQKISLKFNGIPPAGFPVNEDIRGSSLLDKLHEVIGKCKSECRSEMGMFLTGLRRLESGRDDLKCKIERTEQGWALKLKWGGNLTPLGVYQAESAGRAFKNYLSPGPIDVKAYSSGDTRCQETAGYFLKGFLEVSEFPIRSDDGPDGLGNLDDTPFRHSTVVEQLRTDIGKILMSGRPIDDEFVSNLFPDSSSQSSGRSALTELKDEFGTFASALIQLKGLVDEFVSVIESLDGSITLYANEDVSLLLSRWLHVWRSLHRVDPARPASPSRRWKAQQTVSGALFSTIQISLIGEIFDNSNYDFRHNAKTLNGISSNAFQTLVSIRRIVTKLSHVVTPLEYGISKQDKAFVGSTFLHPLIRKLRFDLRLSTNLPIRDEAIYLSKHEESIDSLNPRVRLYFAHHSHVFSFISIIRSISLPERFKCNDHVLLSIGSLGYLSQIVLNVFKHKTLLSFWRITIDIYPGDDQNMPDGNLNVEYMRVVEGVTSTAEEIDSFFSDILLLPSRDTRRSTPSHLLASIGESSAETLANFDELGKGDPSLD